MTRAVCPGRLEREQHAAIAEELQPALADRRTQEIATQLLEPRAFPGGHRDIRVEVEAVEHPVADTRRRQETCAGHTPGERTPTMPKERYVEGVGAATIAWPRWRAVSRLRSRQGARKLVIAGRH